MKPYLRSTISTPQIQNPRIHKMTVKKRNEKNQDIVICRLKMMNLLLIMQLSSRVLY